MKREKTTATLLTAIFMISVFAVAIVSAQQTSVEFATTGDGVAEFSTDYAHSGEYSVKFHTDTWDWTNHYAAGIPVDVPLNEITDLSYWRNGMVFDYAPPSVLLCVDANDDGVLDFGISEALSYGPLGDDAILEIGADWIDTGWIEVDVLAKDWRWGTATWFDKNGWSGWVTHSSLEEFIAAGGFGPSDAGYPCPIEPTDNVMLVVIAGGNPDGNLYVDDLTVNEVTYDFEPEPSIEATIDINPDMLNLKSNGRWITAFIELPEGYDVGDIDTTSIVLTTDVDDEMEFSVAEGSPMTIGDCDEDDISDLMVKFDRAELIDCLGELGSGFSEVELEVTGTLIDGKPFTGTDTIRVLKR